MVRTCGGESGQRAAAAYRLASVASMALLAFPATTGCREDAGMDPDAAGIDAAGIDAAADDAAADDADVVDAPDDAMGQTRSYIAGRLLEESDNIVSPQQEAGGFRRACWLTVPVVSSSGWAVYHIGERILELTTTAPQGVSLRVHARPLAGGLPVATPHLVSPGSGSPGRMESICAPNVGASGLVAFTGDLVGDTYQGVWTMRPASGSTTTPLIPPGAQGPGLPAGHILGVEDLLALDPDERALVLARVFGTGLPNEGDLGVWRASTTDVSAIMRETTAGRALDAVDGLFTAGGRAWLRSTGALPRPHRLEEASPPADGGGITTLAATGDPLPVVGTTMVTLGGFGAAGPDVTFAAASGGPVCGLFARRGGTYAVLSSGDPVAVAGEGTPVFGCTVEVPTSPTRQDCFSLTDAILACNACPCGPAPRPPGKAHPRGPVMNVQGDVAAVVTLDGALALIRWTATEVRLVAKAGGPAPDTPPGTSFVGFGPDTQPAAPSMNDQGQIAFYARLAGPGVDASNELALYVTDPITGAPRLLLRAGDRIAVVPDVTIEVTDFEFQNGSGGADGRRTALSAAGDVLVYALFQWPQSGGVQRGILALRLAPP